MKYCLIVGLMLWMALPPAEAAYKAPNPVKDTYEKQLDEAVDAFYQSDWGRAEDLFASLQEMDSDDPRAYFLDSLIPFWAYFFGESESRYADQFLEQSETAITLCEKQLDRNPSDTTMVLMLSALYGYRSLVAASEQNYRTAIQSGMTGFNYTRKIMSLDSDDPRAQIGKGIFYYMVGSVPAEVRWLTNMAGLSGDREEGIELIRQAATADSYVSMDAKMILYTIYDREEMVEQEYEIISNLAEAYPQNIIFNFKLGETLEKLDRPDEALSAYERVVALDNPHLPKLKERSRERIDRLG